MRFCALLLFAALTYCASLAYGDHPRAEPPEVKGLVIKFRAFDPAGQDRLHEQLGAKVRYRSESQAVDLVNLSAAARDSDAAELEKACAEYRKSESVVRCEADHRLVEYEPPCP